MNAFCLFRSSLISFNKGLYSFQMYKSFSYVVNFIAWFFILLDTIVNRIVFLISFLDCSLMMYRDTADLVCWLSTLNFAEFVH